MYSIKNRDEFENLNKLISLHDQVKALGLQERLDKQSFHDDMRRVFEPVTKSVDDVSQDVTKTITEISFENNKALKNLNNELLGILNDRGKTASYLLAPLPKINNPHHTSQFKPVNDPDSNRVNDCLINIT